MIKRRTVLALMAGSAAGTLTRSVLAQPRLILARVAVVSESTVEQQMLAGLTRHPLVPASELPEIQEIRSWRIFLEELERLGWIEDETVTIERWSDGAIDDLEARVQLIAAIRDSSPNVIVARGEATVPVMARTITTIPIVVFYSDPFDSGFVTNMARPEGNVTGTVTRPGGQAAFDAKLIELLTQIVPAVRRVAWVGPEDVFGAPDVARRNAGVVTALAGQGIEVIILASNPASGAPDAIEAWQRQQVPQIVAAGCRGVYFGNDIAFRLGELNRYDFWPRLLLEAGLPSITNAFNFVLASPGALASYGTNTASLWPIMAQQVDRILRGMPIADIPFQATVDSVFRVNLRTAHALGLTISPEMLALATEIIE